MGDHDEPEVPEELELEWDEDEITEVTKLRREMQASLAAARKTLSGVNKIAQDLRTAIVAQGAHHVRRSLTPGQCAVAEGAPPKER